MYSAININVIITTINIILENIVAKIIVITNQKGGVGKSTVTMNLAAGLANIKKAKVLVFDGDPQGTASRWAASASDELPYPANVVGLSNHGEKAHKEVAKFAKDYDYILVDCPPAVENNFTDSVLLIADLALVPIVPSPADLWAAIGIRKLITNVQTLNEGLEARLVANMCQPNTRMSAEAVNIINDFGIKKLNVDIHLRTIYRKSTALGCSVLDLDDEKAALEITKLTKEILSILK